MCKETVSSIHNKAGTHMNSLRLWEDVKYLYKFKPDNISTQRIGIGQKLPPLTQKLFAIDTCFCKKNHFVIWYIRHTPGNASCTEWLANTKWTPLEGSCNFCFILTIICLFGFFLFVLTYIFIFWSGGKRIHVVWELRWGGSWGQ